MSNCPARRALPGLGGAKCFSVGSCLPYVLFPEFCLGWCGPAFVPGDVVPLLLECVDDLREISRAMAFYGHAGAVVVVGGVSGAAFLIRMASSCRWVAPMCRGPGSAAAGNR